MGMQFELYNHRLNHASDLMELASRTAKNILKLDIQFETIVGTGMSGGVIIPTLAILLDKSFLLIRKPNTDSHSDSDGVGFIGESWIFVDDFMVTGQTLDRVYNKIERLAKSAWLPVPELMGAYFYSDEWFKSGDSLRSRYGWDH
jgi:adenine/guanine phosphoribosyltransferase-like PRPP-binding protein